MKLLIIDDDVLIREYVERGLRDDGYTVDGAETGGEGALMARLAPYDAIVLDVQLPDLSGYQVAELLRAEGQTTPILMLTAQTATESLVRGLDAGADDYLTKPFELAELRARLRALLRRGGAQRTENVAIGGLELDRIRHRITIDGGAIRLTPREYRLLEYFMLHPERVVTRTDLLEKVWEIHFDPHSNIVDAHVTRLRQKLRRHPAAPQIATVRGFGFMLTAEPVLEGQPDSR
ncbi:MAG TPA: response regulator transcription factor [Longimicrobiales bacterium]|nr:response regulator transcription factor [Longimicrobiales bacterium]